MAFEGKSGAFSLLMLDGNPGLALITYCEGATGWPPRLPTSPGAPDIPTIPIDCQETPVNLSGNIDTVVVGQGA